MSKVSCKSASKKGNVKLLKRPQKPTKSTNLKITILPVDSEWPPYTKTISNKNWENNLKIVWNKEEILKVYSGVLPKSKNLNFSVYTK